MPDFVAVNIYVPGMYVIASDQAPWNREVPMNVSHPTCDGNAVVSSRSKKMCRHHA